jgi:hypothetical protein
MIRFVRWLVFGGLLALAFLVAEKLAKLTQSRSCTPHPESLEDSGAIQQAGADIALLNQEILKGSPNTESPDQHGGSDSMESLPSEASSWEDSEWLALPREEWDFAQNAIYAPHQLTVRTLLRHKELNPRDVYIPAQHRAELEAILKSRKPSLLEYSRAIARAKRAEFEQAKKQGLAERYEPRVIKQPDGSRVIFPNEVRPGAVMTFKDGTMEVVAREHFRVRDQAREGSTFLAVEQAGQVVMWFEKLGMLDSGRATMILGECADAVTVYLGR